MFVILITVFMAIRKLLKYAAGGVRVAKKDGVLALSIKALQKLQKTQQTKQPQHKQRFHFLVDYQDALGADFSVKKTFPTKPVTGKKLTLNWVMSPPSEGGGGHQNIFRFIKYLEDAGHTCRVYLYSTFDKRSVSEVKLAMKANYPKTKASIEWPTGEMKEADAIFATGWETAYPVFNSTLNVPRFYFVQDFEPYFYALGSEYVLAENTYRFGFHGITAGGWLAQKLNKDYGMKTNHFDFGADSKLYTYTNNKKRKEIFFYARPVTTRRGFELGIMALDLFHQQNPDYIINLAGWDVSDYDIPFPYKNMKNLSIDELPTIYNRCAAGLVLSLTNMSLLPLELLACGTIPVLNDSDNNRLVSDNPFLAYTPNNPRALANRLSELVNDPDLPSYAKRGAESLAEQNWDKSGAQFVEIVEGALRHG